MDGSTLSSDPAFVQGLESILAPYRANGASEHEIQQLSQRAFEFYQRQQQQSSSAAECAQRDAQQEPSAAGSSDQVIASVVSCPSNNDPTSTSTSASASASAAAAAAAPAPASTSTSTSTTTSSTQSNEPSLPTSSTSSRTPDNPPYPISFTQLASLIASGAPIPGIKDIPDRLNEGEPTPSQVDLSAVKKPWEK